MADAAAANLAKVELDVQPAVAASSEWVEAS